MQKIKVGLALVITILMLVFLFPISAQAESMTAETVIYNLGNQEITAEKFEPDGSYTIFLEDNAFFPYEVQFKANGVTTTQWFETPNSTVQIGGHDFNVYSAATDDTLISLEGDGTNLNPKGIATRAETATIIMKFINMLVKS